MTRKTSLAKLKTPSYDAGGAGVVPPVPPLPQAYAATPPLPVPQHQQPQQPQQPYQSAYPQPPPRGPSRGSGLIQPPPPGGPSRPASRPGIPIEPPVSQQPPVPTQPDTTSPYAPPPPSSEYIAPPPPAPTSDVFGEIEPMQEQTPVARPPPPSSSYEPSHETPRSVEYKPEPSQPVVAPTVPVDPYQPKSGADLTPSAYITPAPNQYSFANPPIESPAAALGPDSKAPFAQSGSAYEPALDHRPANLDEDVLERSSPAAKRVPCVSFGPRGLLVVAFPSDTPQSFEDGQPLLPAYGDPSPGQQVSIRKLDEVIPVIADSGSTSGWPGPLFDPSAAKSGSIAKKKREAVNAYIDNRTHEITSGLVYLTASKKDEKERYREEARLLMLEVVKVMIAGDGKLAPR